MSKAMFAGRFMSVGLDYPRLDYIRTLAAGAKIEPSDEDLKLYMSFNVKDSTTAYDYSPANNDGTVTGASIVVDNFNGYAFDFDGTDDYISGPNTGISDAPLTVTAWVKYADNAGSILHERGDGISSGSGGFNLNVNSSGKLAFTSFGIKDYASSNTALTSGTWQFVCVVLDSSFDVTYYLDGSADGTDTHNVDMKASAADWLIGGFRGAGSYPDISFYLKATVDDVRVYDRELSATEIEDLYLAKKPVLGNVRR